jgi:hypothetical protein
MSERMTHRTYEVVCSLHVMAKDFRYARASATQLGIDVSVSSPALAFENYMEHGCCWIGFHGAAYNDESTGWPRFVRFLGGARILRKQLVSIARLLNVDDSSDSVTRRLHGPCSCRSSDNVCLTTQPAPPHARWCP